jgi:hypothetical protein
MPSTPAPFQLLQQFRQRLLKVFKRRADALFELVDALLLVTDPRSPVELSTSPAFRRRFSMVYDALHDGQVDEATARAVLAEAEPADAVTLAGYAIYAVDSTPEPRPEAPTLPDRGKVYSTTLGGPVVGHQYSWLGRVVAHGQSWFAPRDVERITTARTPAAVAAQQVARVAASLAAGALAVVVADSGYAKVAFLTVFIGLPQVCVLVRLARNRVLYRAPPPSVCDPHTGKRLKRGRPPVHGAKFRLQAPPPPERQGLFEVGPVRVSVSAWSTLHFKTLPGLVGQAIRIEFLKADGQPKYQRPLWLFWGGPSTVALLAVSQMYLLRFGIEHFFRFLKQHLGLTLAQVTSLAGTTNWVWTVTFAYVHLLLARAAVSKLPRPWDPAPRRDPGRPLTPGQVRRAWAAFSHGLGTPAAAPRPSGKAPGRAPGFQPQPRAKYPVISKKLTAAATGAV